MDLITSMVIGSMFAVGLYQILQRHLIRAAIGLMLTANAVNLFLLTTGALTGTTAAYVQNMGSTPSDALPQALILTAIVIKLGGAAFVLALVAVITGRYRTSNSDELRGLKH